MADNNVVQVHMAKLTISYQGMQGDLPDYVPYDATDEAIKAMATEAVSQGYVPGIDAIPNANFADFMVDRFPARGDVQYNRLSLRAKTAFGG